MMDPPTDTTQKIMVTTRVPFLFYSSNLATSKPSSTTTNGKPRNPQPQPPPPTALNTTITSTKKSEWIKNPNPPIALNQMCLIEEEEKKKKKKHQVSPRYSHHRVKKKKKEKESSGSDSPAKLDLWSCLSPIHWRSFRSLWSIRSHDMGWAQSDSSAKLDIWVGERRYLMGQNQNPVSAIMV